MKISKFNTRIKNKYRKVFHLNRVKVICQNLFSIDFKISKKHIKELQNGY